MDLEQPVIRISVRNLVEFVLRSGDIDNRRTAGAQKEAMQEGTKQNPQEDSKADGSGLSCRDFTKI